MALQELDRSGPRSRYYADVPDRILSARRLRGTLSVERTRRLAAVMFADMVGYTALMQEDEERARIQRDRQRAVLAAAVPRHHGEILQFYGDGTLSVFRSAVEAVECAVAIQLELRESPEVPLRIGVHSGDIVYDQDGVYGDGVNVAARIQALSASGGILISGKVFDEIKNHPALSTVFLGQVPLKNVKRPVDVFAIGNAGLPVPSEDDVRASARGDVLPVPGLPDARIGPAAGSGEAFLRRVRERSVAQWALVYLAAAWSVLEVARFLSQRYVWPAAIYPALTVVAFVGFFVAVVVTWFHGERGRQRVRGTEVLIIGVLLLTAAVALTALPDARPIVAGSGTPSGTGLADDRPSVAVLPFENLSTEPENAYFASGLHDEVITQLLHVSGLRVISRTSVLEYAGDRPNVRQIGRDLGVSHVAEATVQRIDDRLRVNVQLIDARTDGHLWAALIDRELNDAFAVQSEIARSIADSLARSISSAERGAITRPPTDDPDAYRFYLQGRDYYLRPGYRQENLEAAERLFAQATARDPGFGLAYAELSRVHGLLYWENFDPAPSRLEAQRAAAAEALRLEPGLPQAHVAAGWMRYVEGDFGGALAEYAAALEGLPNDAELVASMGYTHRRLGNLPRVFEAFDRATSLNPRNANLYYDLGGHSFAAARRYGDAMAAYNRAMELAPDLYDAAIRKGYLWKHWRGELDTLRAVMDRLPRDLHLPEIDLARIDLALWERDPERILGLLAVEPDRVVFETQVAYLPGTIWAGWAHRLRGDAGAARVAFDSARITLEALARERPGDVRVRVALGYAYAGLGRAGDAAASANLAISLSRPRGGALAALQAVESAAGILAQAGLAAEAVRQLRVLLDGNSPVTVNTLRLNPLYDPIREDPGFRALLRR